MIFKSTESFAVIPLRYSRIASFCAVVVTNLALLAALGWVTGASDLASLDKSYIPMAPSTSILFFLFSSSLSLFFWKPNLTTKIYALLAMAIAFCFTSWTLLSFSGVVQLDLEKLILSTSGHFNGVPTGRMSPMTACNFMVLSISFFLFSQSKNKNKIADIAGAFATTGYFFTLIILMGYLYGTPILYGSPVIPMALTTAVAFFAIYTQLICFLGAEHFPLRMIVGTTAQARLLRAFLPVSFFSIIIHGSVSQFIVRNFDVNFALLSAISAALFSLVTVLITTQVSKMIGKQLDESEKVAKQLSMLKTEFLNNMSHELRTPLNAIIGTTDILIESPMSEEQKDCLTAIKKSGESLLHIVDDILSFSIIHRKGKVPFKTREFHMKVILEQILKTFETAAQEKGLDLELTIAPEVPERFYGDVDSLSRVLFHLIENSVKFTERGKIVLSVSLLAKKSGKSLLQFSVLDTGIGIPQMSRDKIFNIFFQADGATNRRLGGTGVGLALCKTIVEAAGGKIQFQSEEKKGTRFWFFLEFQPIIHTEVHIQNQETFIADLPKAIVRVLIAEDDPINQMVTKRMVEKMGYQVQLVPNGEEAVRAMERERPDLILMDCQMPHVDGFEATSTIRKIERRMPEISRIPIIALTAHVTDEAKRMCLDAGMDDFLTKPVKLDSLKKVIEDWVNRNASAAI